MLLRTCTGLEECHLESAMSMSGNGQWYESVAVELYMSTGQRSKQSWSCELLNTLRIMHSKGRLLVSSICRAQCWFGLSYVVLNFICDERKKYEQNPTIPRCRTKERKKKERNGMGRRTMVTMRLDAAAMHLPWSSSTKPAGGLGMAAARVPPANLPSSRSS